MFVHTAWLTFIFVHTAWLTFTFVHTDWLTYMFVHTDWSAYMFVKMIDWLKEKCLRTLIGRLICLRNLVLRAFLLKAGGAGKNRLVNLLET